MFTVKIHAKGINDLQEWLHDLETLLQYWAAEPAGYFRDLLVPMGLRAWDLVMRVDGLEHQQDRQGAMDALFEDLLQVTVNFHADDGGHFTLTEKTADGEVVLFDEDVRCTCGDEAVAVAEQVLQEGT